MAGSENIALSPESNLKTIATHAEMANAIRALSMDAVQAANSGHPGMPMGMADVATVLFREFLKFDPKHPNWPDRDRFILSAGHGSMLLYSLLHLTGYADMTLEEIKNFRQMGAKTAGHPEYGHATGIETTTGPLGQGIANSVGMALAEQMMTSRFGTELVDHYTYVIAGDGCLMEGISQEAISLAGHLKLNKLIVLWDDNSISIDGGTELATSEDILKRFEATGWDTQAVDGHAPIAIEAAIRQAHTTNTPSLIACKTIIGFGSPNKAGKSSSHGSPLGDTEIEGTREQLGWTHAPFDIPDHILSSWRQMGEKHQATYEAWSNALETSDHAEEFSRRVTGELPEGWLAKLDALKEELVQNHPKEATRKSSGNTLEVLVDTIPELIGGSADLTGSNLTKTKDMHPVSADDFSGNYIYYGVREHSMVAAMNGMALHGGFIPYGGTFMVFTDYCRPAIRLAALMGIRSIFVMTHDSIGLGEDGPTHQPVEHLASLRAIPNLNVFRPCDATETAECWSLSLATQTTPSILSLTRQGVPHLREEFTPENKCARGGYLLREQESATVTLIATGSEVSLAVEAMEQLKDKDIIANVVSIPCWELFDEQPGSYKNEVLGSGLRIAIEAASGFGWDKYLGENGQFIGMNSFGASAPAGELYTHFGITTEAIVKTVENKVA